MFNRYGVWMAYRNYLVISVILLLVAGYWLYDDSMGGINPVGWTILLLMP